MSLWSAGAVAAVLKNALLEKGTELADVVFGEVAVAVGSERRAGGGEHHPEQVPQVALQVIAALSHHALVAISKKFLWRELKSRKLRIF